MHRGQFILQVIGRKRTDEEDASSIQFLASDAEECCEETSTLPGSVGVRTKDQASGGGGSMSSSSTSASMASSIRRESAHPHNTRVFVWGLNDKDQLGGLKGSKIKLPVFQGNHAISLTFL